MLELNDPEGTIARVASFVPTTAPMVMPARIVLEVPGAIAATAAAAALLVPLAGRIDASGVLRTGRAVPLREALRARAA